MTSPLPRRVMPHINLDVDDPIVVIQSLLSQLKKDTNVDWRSICNAAILYLLRNQDQGRSLNVSVERVLACFVSCIKPPIISYKYSERIP